MPVFRVPTRDANAILGEDQNYANLHEQGQDLVKENVLYLACRLDYDIIAEVYSEALKNAVMRIYSSNKKVCIFKCLKRKFHEEEQLKFSRFEVLSTCI